MLIKTRWIPFLAAASVVGIAASAPGGAKSYYETVLRDGNVVPDRAGLSEYLEQLHPSPEQRRRIARLITELGDPTSFAAREAAMSQLIAMPVPPTAALIEASQSDDPEIRWRAWKVLQRGQREGERILFAALMTIHQSEMQGLVEPLLRAIPLCQAPYVRQAANQAVAASARDEDADVLRGALADKDIHVRIAAIGALGHVLGVEATEELHSLLRDGDDRIRLAAARALANLGDRRSLPPLVELLSSDSVEIRAASGATLWELTGVHIPLAAYDAPEKREEKVNRWRKWVAANGKTAELHFPLRPGAVAEIGHTVISAYSEGRVIVLDEQKKQIMEIVGYSGPWGVERLANGNFLVNWYASSCVVEYDPTGKEVWKFQRDEVNSPWSAQRLPNGNTLIAHSNTALEVDPDGNTVWQREFDGTLSQAIRLDNGNTLVATLAGDARVVEVDPSGEEVFQIKGLSTPYRIQRLANGNTLVVERGRNRVVEFDPSGRTEVWSHANLSSPDGAHRLANGNTLITDGQTAVEIDPSGKTIWQRPGTQSLISAY